MHATQALIIGNGFLGRYVCRALAGQRLIAVNRLKQAPSPRADTDSSNVALACDIFDERLISRISSELGEHVTDVYFLLPPSAFPAIPPGTALKPFVDMLHAHSIHRVVVTSSTGVFNVAAGESVYSDTPARPHTARGTRLLAIEQAWTGSSCPASVARLGGLYGVERIIGRDSVAAGQALPGAGSEWLNLIHAEDAARALVAIAVNELVPTYTLITDGNPLRRLDYYSALAHHLRCPVPQFDDTVPRRGSSRRCDPSATWAALGIKPNYPNAELALGAMFAGQG